MGVDLTLMPLIGEDYWAAHDLIQVERRRELWDEIAKLPSRPVRSPLSCFVARMPNGEQGYGNLETDPYGEKMRYMTPEVLLLVKDHEAVTDNWRNRAVWDYLAKMPPNWPIVLYWH